MADLDGVIAACRAAVDRTAPPFGGAADGRQRSRRRANRTAIGGLSAADARGTAAAGARPRPRFGGAADGRQAPAMARTAPPFGRAADGRQALAARVRLRRRAHRRRRLAPRAASRRSAARRATGRSARASTTRRSSRPTTRSSRMPWDVWAWYLYRRGVCRRAEPNAGHRALVRLDAALADRFALVTQNVDGLHRRAGSPTARTFAIHGDIDLMRCAAECVPDRWPIPEAVPPLGRASRSTDAIARAARLPALWRPGPPARAVVRRDLRRARGSTSTRAPARRRGRAARDRGDVGADQPAVAGRHARGARAARRSSTSTSRTIRSATIAARAGGVVRAPAAIALPAIVDALISSARQA